MEIQFKDQTAIKLDDLLTGVLPTTFDLSQNYPNPFNPGTEIKYSLASPGKVTLQVFNMLGQKVKTLIYENKPAGDFSVSWDGKDELQTSVASGIYFYKLEVNGKDFSEVFIKKMIKLQ